MKLYIEKDFQQQRVKFWLVKDKEHSKVYLGHDKGVLTEYIQSTFSPIDMDVKPFLELEYSLADDFIKLIAEYANSNNIKTEQRSFIEGELIEACRYGYNYHKTSQFPEMEFDDMAINNFKQHLQAGLLSPSTETDKSEAVEFAEWVGRNYSMVAGSEICKWVSLSEEILAHGSLKYYDKLILEHGKTTPELYSLFKQNETQLGKKLARKIDADYCEQYKVDKGCLTPIVVAYIKEVELSLTQAKGEIERLKEDNEQYAEEHEKSCNVTHNLHLLANDKRAEVIKLQSLLTQKDKEIEALREVVKKCEVIINNGANMVESTVLKNAMLLSLSSLNIKSLLNPSNE